MTTRTMAAIGLTWLGMWGCKGQSSPGEGGTTPVDPRLGAAQQYLDSATVGLCDGDVPVWASDALEQAIQDAQNGTDAGETIEDALLAVDEALAAAQEATLSHRDDLTLILNDVDSVEEPGGTPSHFGVVGCNAMAVFQATRWEHPTVVAGRAGDGRVAVFAKEISSYLPSLEGSDTKNAQLAANLLDWLTAEHPEGYANSQQSGKPMKVLVNHAYDAFDEALGLELMAAGAPAADPALWDAKTYPLAIVNPRIEDPADVDVLRTYLADGGSLLMGHQVWTWYTDKQRSAGQTLLADAGLLWRNWYGTGGGEVPPVDDLLQANTHHLLDWLSQVEADWENHEDLGYDPEEATDIVNYVVRAYEWMPQDATSLITPLSERYDAIDVTYPAELAERPYARVTVPLVHLVLELAPDQGPGKGVDVFPGAVDDSAARVTETVVYDFDREDPSYLEVPVEPRARVSTGLYAPPAENVTITVTADGLDTSTGLGLTLFVGAHTDDLSDKEVLDRPPIVAFRAELVEGSQVVNNPYGGQIYLQADPVWFRPGQAQVTFDGVVLAPNFVSGEMNDADWSDWLADRPAPWGDIVAPTMIGTLPRYQLEQISSPQSVADAWTSVVDCEYDLMGLDDALGWPHQLPQGTHHYVSDAQISAGWMHSGYPIMAFTAAELHLVDNVKSWGPWHELGHNLQQPEWRMTSSVEVSNNIYSLYCQQVAGEPSRLVEQDTYVSADDALAAGGDWASLDVWQRLTLYRRLSLAYDWEFYRELVRRTRELHDQTGGGLANGQSAEDYMLVEGSRIAGEDLTEVFDYYGLVLSQDARDEVVGLGLPAPNPPIQTLSE